MICRMDSKSMLLVRLQHMHQSLLLQFFETLTPLPIIGYSTEITNKQFIWKSFENDKQLRKFWIHFEPISGLKSIHISLLVNCNDFMGIVVGFNSKRWNWKQIDQRTWHVSKIFVLCGIFSFCSPHFCHKTFLCCCFHCAYEEAQAI